MSKLRNANHFVRELYHPVTKKKSQRWILLLNIPDNFHIDTYTHIFVSTRHNFHFQNVSNNLCHIFSVDCVHAREINLVCWLLLFVDLLCKSCMHLVIIVPHTSLPDTYWIINALTSTFKANMHSPFGCHLAFACIHLTSCYFAAFQPFVVYLCVFGFLCTASGFGI